MRLKLLSLKNFRCFPDETIEFDPYTALVGANNAGKSAIIAAIDIFFRSNPKSIPLSIDDFFRREIDRDLEITLTFADLNDDALEEFAHYARAGLLTFFIKAKIVDGSVTASLHGIRFANPQFAPFFELGSAAEKKSFYESLSKTFRLDKWQNQNQAAEALRVYENNNPTLNSSIPSNDRAFGIEGPVPRLRQFIDFVFIPAVKDAGDEAVEARNTAFSKLVDRAVRARLKIDERIEKIRGDAGAEIAAIANDHQEILGALANKIDQEYRKFNSVDSKIHLDWGTFDEKNLQINLPPVHLQISDDLITNKIGKFGHGTQRNYLMALLLVSASYDFGSLQTIIIACEEPELYQHPPQAKILANAFLTLVSNQAQLIITTHSPYFITARSFENIRLVRRSLGRHSKTYSWSVDENCSLIGDAKGEQAIGGLAARAMINQFLQPQTNEMFFSPCLILVEGDEDRSILSKYMLLRGLSSELLALGAHIVPMNGKGNLINALAIVRGFQIPFFAVFDGDMNLQRPEDIQRNTKLNKDIFSLLKFDGPERGGTFDGHVWGGNFCVWKDSLQAAFDDLKEWEEEKQKVCEDFGWTIDRLRKNPMVLEAALERIYKEQPIPHLEKLCSAIFANFGLRQV
jgi:predicted ATP-dependent endonuclease of OLD family